MNIHPTDALATLRIETTRWHIDPARSSVEFQVKAAWGLATVKGRFARYQGTLDLGAEPAIELVVDADSLDTENEKRDEHLRSADFFDVERHPYVRFASDGATLAGERLNVRGRLHARGRSMPLELEVTLRRVGDELQVEAATEIDHGRLGMTWNKLGMVGRRSRLVVQGRLVAAGVEGAAAA